MTSYVIMDKNYRRKSLESLKWAILVAIAFLFLALLLSDAASAGFLISPKNAPVQEGSTRSVRIWLDEEPALNVTGTLQRTNGDTDLAVQGTGVFSIPKAQWSTGVELILTAAEDADSTSGQAVFQVQETSANGLASKNLLAIEMENDGLIEVGGTLAADTVWNDTTHNYLIKSDVVVPVTYSLQIGPNVVIQHDGQNHHGFVVSGRIGVATDSTLFMRTYTYWEGVWKRDGIILENGASAKIDRCRLLTWEERDRGGEGRDLWSAVVRAKAKAQLSLHGTTLECVNAGAAYYTGYGVLIDGCTTSITSAGSTPTTFRGFRSGIFQTVSHRKQSIAACFFQFCGVNQYLSGDMLRDNTFVNEGMHITGTLTVKKNVTMTLAAGTDIYLDYLQYFIVDGGTFNATDVTFGASTRNYYWIPEFRNGMDIKNKAKLNLRRCQIYTDESRETWNINEWSAAISADASSEVSILGCAFESRKPGDRRTGFGVELNGCKAVIGNDGATPTSFKGFHWGIHQYFGTESQEIAKCTFEDCESNHRISSDVKRNFTLTNPGMNTYGSINVLSGATLTLAPGCELYSWYGDRFTVDGAHLVANQASITVEPQNTYYQPNFRNGIDFKNNSTGTFTRCSLYTNETRHTDSISEWAALLYADDTSTLDVRGTTFVSKNPGGRRTGYGIHVSGGALNVVAQDGIDPSFTGFRCGFLYEFGSKQANIAKGTFTNTDYQGAISGNVTHTQTFQSENQHHFFGAVTVKTGSVLTLPANSSYLNNSYFLTIEAGASLALQADTFTINRQFLVSGTLAVTNTQFYITTVGHYHPDYRYNGFNLLDGSNSFFTNCTFRAEEIRTTGNDGDYAAIISQAAQASLDMAGCFFAPPVNPSMPTRFGIRSWSVKNFRLTGCTFLENYIAIREEAAPSAAYAHTCNFMGNTYAVDNTTQVAFNATNNWWGSPTGPTHLENPGGTGDRVSDYVDYGKSSLELKGSLETLANPSTGQEGNNLLTTGTQAGMEMLGCRITPGNVTSVDIGFHLYNSSGLDWTQFSNFFLVRDSNNNGTADASEKTSAISPNRSTSSSSGLYVGFSNIPLSSSLSKQFILIGDITGVESNDAFSVSTYTGWVMTTAGVPIDDQVTATRHKAGQFPTLANPNTGQVSDNFSSSSRQSNVVLYGFQLKGETQKTKATTFRLTGVQAITRSIITTAALYRDLDNDALLDSSDTRIGSASEVVVSGNTGSISFPDALDMNQHYLVVASFRGLSDTSRMTIQLDAADIKLTSSGEVLGSANAVTHIVDMPYMISQSDLWTPSAYFGLTTDQSNFALVGLRIQPLGRTVNSITVRMNGVIGIYTGEMLNPRLMWDKNENGVYDTGDELVVQGQVSTVASNEASMTFTTAFITRGYYFILADFQALSNGDELTVRIDPEDVSVPETYRVTGSVPPIRFVVESGTPDSRSQNMNWTLTYRSPGGRTVMGHYNNAGDKVILGYDTGSAWIYQATSNTPLMMLKDHYDCVEYAGFSSDDSAAITVSRDGAVFIWDLQTGIQRSAMFSDLLVSYGVPSPDLSKLMVITEGKGILLDIDNQTRLWEFVPGDATVNAIAYSPDGKYILIGSSDKKAYLLDVTTGVEVRRYLGHTQGVTAVAFTGDGTKLMTGSTDATVQLWNTAGGSPIATISLQGQASQGATVSPDGSRVAMVTGYGTSAQLRIFNSLGLELFAVNINTESGGNWGTYLENVAFDHTGERVLVSTRDSDWARIASFRVDDGDFLVSWGPHGRYPANTPMRPRISNDGSRLFAETDWGLNVMSRTMGNPIFTVSTSLGDRGFDISGDGTKCNWFDYSGHLRISTVSDNGAVEVVDRNVGVNYNWTSTSEAGDNILAGDRMYSGVGGGLIANYALTDRETASAFSPDSLLWGFTVDHSLVTCRVNDPNATLYNMMDTGSYSAYKLFYHPDGVRIGCVDSNTGVQMYNMSTDLPVGLYRFQYNSDASLSKDGTLLLIGGRNTVKLFDVRTGRILRYFYPQHSSIADVDVRAVQFAKNDTLIMIAWSYNYIETYERSLPTRIEMTPESRVLAAGDSQAYQVSVIYDDGTKADVTPSSSNTTEKAVLEADDPTHCTINGNVITLTADAAGTVIIRARYRDSGITFSDSATITVGQSNLVELVAQPESLSMIPGVFREISYLARYDDGYEEDVTPHVNLTADRPEDVVIAGQSVKVNLTATPGYILLTGSYTNSHGMSAEAVTTIQSFGLRTQWERVRVTAGGAGLSGAWNPAKTKLAWGSSSGAVSIYSVGLTPSQYSLERIVIAHSAPVVYVNYLSENELITVSHEGTVKKWNLIQSATAPVSIYYHDAPLKCAVRDGTTLALGDSNGAVTLLDMTLNEVKWKVTVHTGAVRSVAIDGTRVMSGGQDTHVKILQRSDGTVIKTIAAHLGPIVSAGFFGSNAIFIASEDQTTSLWRKDTYTIIERYEYGVTPTTAAVVDNELYIGTTGPNAAWIYNTDGLLLRWLEIMPSDGAIATFLADPSGKFVLTGRKTILSQVESPIDGSMVEKTSPFGSYQFWEKGRGIFRGSLAHSYPLTAAHAAPDGKRMFTQDSKRIIEWNYGVDDVTTESQNLLETGYFVNYSFAGMDFNADSSLLATRVDLSIYLFGTQNHLLWRTLHTPGAGPYALSKSGNKIATADWRTRLWDLVSVSQIGESPNPVNSIDFLKEDHFLGGVGAHNSIGIWDDRCLMGMVIDTAHPPIKLYVNSVGTRCAAVTLETHCDMLNCTYDYYLEIFDISDIGVEPPRIGQPLFLMQTNTDIFGGGEGEVNSAIAVSDDAGLVLVGSEGDRPVKLISTADGQTIREFEPPSGKGKENTGAAAVAFADNDKAVLIGWREGFAETHRRVDPNKLKVEITKTNPAKDSSAHNKVVVEGGTVYVSAGDQLATETLANYTNNSELNVTAVTGITSSNNAVASVSGRYVHISGSATEGQQAKLTFTYSELGTNLQMELTLLVGTDPKTLGDTTGDLVVNYLDILNFSRWWKSTDTEKIGPCDKVNDGKVDAIDLNWLLNYW